MSKLSRPNQKDGLWRYACIGGLASIPLSLGYYWWSGMGDHFSTLPILFGGLLAGYLAQKHSREPAQAGACAGLIGGVPGYVWILPQLAKTATSVATAWSSPLGFVVVLAFPVPAIAVVAALPGWLGGVVGGWLEPTLGRTEVAALGF